MRIRSHKPGFTIIEVLIALAMFSMIILGVYTIWYTILRSSRAGLSAAASAQRARISIRTIEDALLTAQMFNANARYYAFVADTSGDFASLSMVSRLPASFPGVGRFGDHVVRRVSFTVEEGADREPVLVMQQGPMMMAASEDFEPYSLVLARDLSLFLLEFWDDRQGEWMAEWTSTNQLPSLVRVVVGLGKGSDGKPLDFATRVVALPATAVLPEWQLPTGGARAPGAAPGAPGVQLPGQQGRQRPGGANNPVPIRRQ